VTTCRTRPRMQNFSGLCRRGWSGQIASLAHEIITESRSSCNEGSVAEVGARPTDEKRTSVSRAQSSLMGVSHLQNATSQRTRLQRRCASETGASVLPKPQPTPSHSDSGPCGHAATCSPGLPFNGLHPRNPYNYMDYYLFTDSGGTEG